MSIKVLIADDVGSVRRLEKRVLENEAEIEVVGEAADAPEAIRLTGELKPDVIVMDLNMPGDGFTATRIVKARRPQVKVLAFTADLERYGPDAVRELGADALLPKTAIGQELIAAIKRLARIAA
jgi:DNA-binding NarL/FixJ family response regulator